MIGSFRIELFEPQSPLHVPRTAAERERSQTLKRVAGSRLKSLAPPNGLGAVSFVLAVARYFAPVHVLNCIINVSPLLSLISRTHELGVTTEREGGILMTRRRQAGRQRCASSL